MSEDKNDQRSSISNARSPEKIGEYWDSHSLADHWDQTHEVEFEIRDGLSSRSERQHKAGGVTPGELTEEREKSPQSGRKRKLFSFARSAGSRTT